METNVCHGTTKTGSPCDAAPLNNSDFCFFHDPARSEERLAASRRGGLRADKAVLSPDVPDVVLKTAGDVLALIATTASQVRRGEIDTKIANCLAALCIIALRAIENSDLERRLNELESVAARNE